MSTSPKPKRIDWADVPIVIVVRPTCPECGSTEYTTTRSEPNGDGSTTRKAVCRNCESPFKIAIELPEFGNDESPIE